MEATTPVVASSATPDPTPIPAIEQALSTGDMAGYKAARLAERAGKPIEPTNPADTASAQPDGQAASTDAMTKEAASEPAKGAGHKGNAETRIQELLAERGRERDRAERAERRLAELESGRKPQQEVAKPASQPAAAADPEPKLEDFENEPDPYLAFSKATAKWEARRIVAEQQADARKQADAGRQAQERQQRESTFNTRIAEAKKADPEYTSKLNQDVLAPLVPLDRLADPTQGTRINVIAQAVYASPHAADLLLHLSEHPEDVARLENLPDPGAMAYELGLIAADRRHKPAPVPKTITDAPPPPRTVGTKGTDAVDALEAAVHSGDQAAYKAARLRERLANLHR